MRKYVPTSFLSMFVILSLLDKKPKYPTYRSKVMYTMPWANNTQFADVAYDQQSLRTMYQFYNFSNQICEKMIGFVNTQLYGRTAKNKYECQNTVTPFADTYIAFVPDLENFTKLADEWVNGVYCSHYRFVGEYISNQTRPYNYTAVRTYQQDFYCKQDSHASDNCVPLRWVMNSKSNFDSHPNIYVIEYANFQFEVSDADFEMFNNSFYDAQCPSTPTPDNASAAYHSAKSFFANFQIPKQKLQGTVAKNMRKIEQWRKNKDFTFSVAPNHLIHMEFDEFKKQKLGKRNLKAIKAPVEGEEIYPAYVQYFLNTPAVEDLPTNLDWRTRGIMMPVKDQLFCGNCWAFSATGTIEAHVNLARLNNPSISQFNATPLVSLSEQWLTDCFWDENGTDGWQGCQGCDGGDEDEAMYNQVGSTVLTAEHAYPFLGHSDWCKSNLTNITGYNVTAWHRIPYYNQVQMKRAIMNGPVAIGISVPETMVYYSGGIYNDPDCNSSAADIVHAVMAIGWGESEYGPYWIVRNSWSPFWGMDGYIYIAMKDNLCAVTTQASWVEVEEIAPTKDEKKK